MSYVTVDVDIDDIIDGMYDRDKQQLANGLYDDGYVPSQLKHIEALLQSNNATTTSEIELLDILNKVWENRDFLTAGNIDALRSLSKKGFY